MKALRDLPNLPGYRFIGIDLDGQEHPCIVVKDAIGCCTVRRIADMEPFFFRLHGWRSDEYSESAQMEKP